MFFRKQWSSRKHGYVATMNGKDKYRQSYFATIREILPESKCQINVKIFSERVEGGDIREDQISILQIGMQSPMAVKNRNELQAVF